MGGPPPAGRARGPPHPPPQPSDPTKFTTTTAEADTRTEEVVEGALYGDEVRIYAELAQALRGRTPFAVNPEDALELSRVLDAIRTSAEENRVIEL